jgi:F0F1-type ATP synthase membrane subunit a
MKKFLFFLVSLFFFVFFMQSIPLLQAQNIEGSEFWLTFAVNQVA